MRITCSTVSSKQVKVPEYATDRFYKDASGNCFGEPGCTYSLKDIMTMWNEDNATDPSMAEYDSFEEWFRDCKQNLDLAEKEDVTAAMTFDPNRHKQANAKARERSKYSDLVELCKTANMDNLQDVLQTLFDKLVPAQGKAESLGGELVRAMNKIQYRSYNDGDIFFDGYGLETAGPAAQFIIDNVDGGYDIVSQAVDGSLLYDEPDDTKYRDAIDEMCIAVLHFMASNSEVFTEKTTDMLDSGVSDIEDMAPRYTYDVDLTGDLEDIYIENGCIDYDDVNSFLEELANQYGGYVHSWARDGFEIEYLSHEEYMTWEDNYITDLDLWLEQLAEEFPNAGEEDEDEDYDEE